MVYLVVVINQLRVLGIMNIVEIATKFNVSPVTVSNALNDRKGVSSKLAEKIKNYAHEVGYEPNFLARSLLSGSTKVIGVCLCVPPATPWYGELLSQLQRQLSGLGYYVNTIVLDPFEKREKHFEKEVWAVNFFRQIKAEAILLGPCDLSGYEVLKKQFKALDNIVFFDALDELPSSHLRLDVKGGARMALEYLFANNHRKIGYIGLNEWDRENTSSSTRYANYLRFLNEKNIIFDPDWIVSSQTSTPSEAMNDEIKRRLALPNRVSAYFCHDDNYAALALRAIQECGLRVPEDISIIGFDDQPIAWLSHPGITTIKFDLQCYVSKLVSTLLDCTKNKDKIIHYIEKPVLIERNSVQSH